VIFSFSLRPTFYLKDCISCLQTLGCWLFPFQNVLKGFILYIYHYVVLCSTNRILLVRYLVAIVSIWQSLQKRLNQGFSNRGALHLQGYIWSSCHETHADKWLKLYAHDCAWGGAFIAPGLGWTVDWDPQVTDDVGALQCKTLFYLSSDITCGVLLRCC